MHASRGFFYTRLIQLSDNLITDIFLLPKRLRLVLLLNDSTKVGNK